MNIPDCERRIQNIAHLSYNLSQILIRIGIIDMTAKNLQINDVKVFIEVDMEELTDEEMMAVVGGATRARVNQEENCGLIARNKGGIIVIEAGCW